MARGPHSGDGAGRTPGTARAGLRGRRGPDWGTAWAGIKDRGTGSGKVGGREVAFVRFE
jgi:hypothetical protein